MDLGGEVGLRHPVLPASGARGEENQWGRESPAMVLSTIDLSAAASCCSAMSFAAAAAAALAALARTSAMAARSAAPILSSAMRARRSEEHTSELQSLMRISYAVF